VVGACGLANLVKQMAELPSAWSSCYMHHHAATRSGPALQQRTWLMTSTFVGINSRRPSLRHVSCSL